MNDVDQRGDGPEWLPAWTEQEGAQRAAAAFREHFGIDPDGVWSAPGRVNVIGEHTDYNGGLCLPMALPHRTYVAVSRRGDDTVRLVSAQEQSDGDVTLQLSDVAPGSVRGWGAYAVGVAWALQQAGHEVGGFDAAVDSCVPYGAGLSSSAALECAVAVALDELYGLGLGVDRAGRARLAQACVRAENDIAGAPTGGMDQSASLLCTAGHALLLDCLDGSTQQIPFDLPAHDLALLVIDTRASHQLADGQYAARRSACERAAEVLGVATLREVTALEPSLERLGAVGFAPEEVQVARRRVRHVVTEIARVRLVESLLEQGQVAQVGAVLTAAHASLRDDYEVSSPALDALVEIARGVPGVHGARLTGAGFGGCTVNLVDPDAVPALTAAVEEAYSARTGLGARVMPVRAVDGVGWS